METIQKYSVRIFLLTFWISIVQVFAQSSDISQALEYREKKQYDKALDILKGSNFVNVPEAELLSARIYIDMMKHEDAIKVYSRLCPILNSHDCHNEMGIASLMLGDKSRAIESFKKALAIQPKSEHALTNLAQAYYASEKHKEAKETYEKSISISPHNPVLQVNYAVFLMNTKKNKEAKIILDKIIKEYPTMFYAHLYVGIIHYRRTEYNSALLHFNKAIDLYPDYYDLYYNRALVHYKRGDYSDALNDLKKVDKLNPSNKKTDLLRKLIKFNAGS